MIAGGTQAPRLGLGLRAQVTVGTLLLATPALLVLLARDEALHAALGGRTALRPIVLSGLLGAALWVASIGVMELQSLVLPPPPGYLEGFRALHRALAPKGPIDALVSLAVIAVLPALCEELVVRGVLLPALAVRLGSGVAIVASALLFAAMHLDPYRTLFTFAMGAMFGVLRVMSASLWPSVTAHLSLNALTFAIAPLVDDPTQPYTPEPLLGLACLLAGTALVWPLLRQLARASPQRPGA